MILLKTRQLESNAIWVDFVHLVALGEITGGIIAIKLLLNNVYYSKEA